MWRRLNSGCSYSPMPLHIHQVARPARAHCVQQVRSTRLRRVQSQRRRELQMNQNNHNKRDNNKNQQKQQQQIASK